MEAAEALWEARRGTLPSLEFERKWGLSCQRGELRLLEGEGTASADTSAKKSPTYLGRIVGLGPGREG